jgi:DNA-binding PadR family transcriptional regulator
VLELAILGLLKETPMSGYELQKQLTAKLGAFWRVSFGSLYPCLKRLSSQGAIEVLDPERLPVAPRSRKKHVYQLTERGERLFQELLESTDVHDLEQDRFPLRLAFFRYLNPETRLDQLERRRGYLQQRLTDLRLSMRTARDRMDAYTLSLLDHGLEEREREIAWLDRLIASEREQALDVGTGSSQSPGPATPPEPGVGAEPLTPAQIRRRAAAERRAARRRRRSGETTGPETTADEGPAPSSPEQDPGDGPFTAAATGTATSASVALGARDDSPTATSGPELAADGTLAPQAGPTIYTTDGTPAPQAGPTISGSSQPAPAGGVAQIRRISG